MGVYNSFIMKSYIGQIFDALSFQVDHADHTVVSDWWASYAGLFPYTRLYLITKGSAEIALVDKTLRLEEGNIYVVPPNSVISGSCNQIMEHYWIHLIGDTLSESIINYSDIPHVLPAPPHSESLFSLVQDNYLIDNEYSRIVVNHAIKLLFAEFFRDGIKLNTEFLRFKSTVEYIEDNIEKNISLAELADTIHLHPTYFSNLFTKVFRESPQRYIFRRKMNLACKLLATDIGIADIAEKLSFYDAAHFSRLFKKYFGFSPKQFRTMLKK